MRRFICCLALAAMLSIIPAARAEKVYLKDGRVLDGKFVRLEGVAIDPNNAGGADTSKPIEMCDDDLRRTMFPWRLADKVDPAPPPRWEMFKLEQPVAINGLPVATIGPIVRLTPFDDWGRRTFSMQTNDGVANVIQGLTTVTPLWSSVESLKGGKAYLWDMRIATSSIPRELLTKILLKQIDPRNADQRLKLVRFYMQAERFADAEFELKQVIADFPVARRFGRTSQSPAAIGRRTGAFRSRSSAQGGPIRRRLRHVAAVSGARNQRNDVASGSRKDRSLSHGSNKSAMRRSSSSTRILAQVKESAIRTHLKPIRDEIAAELSLATLDRMCPVPPAGGRSDAAARAEARAGH